MDMATDRTVYVGNIGKEVDNTTLGHLFQHCGQVSNIRIAGEPTYETRYAFVEFGSDQAAETALLLDGMDVFGRKIRVNFARGGGGPGIVRSNDPDRVTRTVHIGGFPMEDVNEEQLAEYFSHVGEVMAVRKSGRFAWIEFSTLKAAQQALQLDGETMGNGTLKVQQSKTPIMSAGWRAAPKPGKSTTPGAPAASSAPAAYPAPPVPAASAPPPAAAPAPVYPPYAPAPAYAPPVQAPVPPYAAPPPGPAPYGAPPPSMPPPLRPPGPRPPPGPPPPHFPGPHGGPHAGPPPQGPFPGHHHPPGGPPRPYGAPPPGGPPPPGFRPPPPGHHHGMPGPPPVGYGPPPGAYMPHGPPPPSYH